MAPVSVGVLGCGTISDAYFAANDRFDEFEIVACGDVDTDAATATADEHGIKGYDVDGLLDSSADLIVNLTPPSVHAETCREVLEAGKHVYVEKPLAASVADSEVILETAGCEGLHVGSAPDTVLGAGLQTCRALVDEGRIGDPLGATAVWTSSGHETWHPNPDFYYHEGGGPLFDMGPYYVTGLVSLIGPIERVAGSVATTFPERTITSEPRRGETIDVTVPTHESAVIEFENGAIANLLLSFDVQGSEFPSPTYELYGTEGTIGLPDPNHFEGPVRVGDDDGFENVALTHEYTDGRGAGVADLARAIGGEWSHRTSASLAHHVLDVLQTVRRSADRGEHVIVETTCDRPDPIPNGFPDK